MPVLVLLLSLMALLQPVCAVEPTLARLTFVVAPERRADFERLYEQKLVPILLDQGFVSSAEAGRTTVDSAPSWRWRCSALTLRRPLLNPSGV